MKFATIAIALLLAGCLSASESEDQAIRGEILVFEPVQTERISYEDGPILVQGSAGAYIVDIEGEGLLPEGDHLPLVIIMHGRHGTCATPAGEFLVPACQDTPATAPVDSHLGYGYMQTVLSQAGFAVVSIDANGVNDLDGFLAADDAGATARANLIQEHVDYIFSQPLASRLSGEIGLVGHSRGGEGVTTAIHSLNPAPSAVLAIAPTDFSNQNVGDTPFLVILPDCDGDVSDLQGADLYRRGWDQRGPRHQVLVHGANHNFFNTIWYQNDNSQSTTCQQEEYRMDMQLQEHLGGDIAGSFFKKYMQNRDDGDLWSTCAWNCPTNIRQAYTTGDEVDAQVDGCGAGHNVLGGNPADASQNCQLTIEADEPQTLRFSAVAIEPNATITVKTETDTYEVPESQMRFYLEQDFVFSTFEVTGTRFEIRIHNAIAGDFQFTR